MFLRLRTLIVTSAASVSLLITTRSVAATDATASPDVAVQSFALANGLRVHVVERPGLGFFSVSLAYRVGARDEEPGQTGYAHVFEHMMFKGSKHVPDGGHVAHVTRVGGDFNGETEYDSTHYENWLPSHALELGLWLEADRMRSLQFDEPKVRNQISAIFEEKRLRFDVPYFESIQRFIVLALAGTPYGHSVIGSDEDLHDADVAQLEAWYQAHYGPSNAVLAIVGDVRLDAVRAAVEQYFGSIADRKAPQRPPVTPKFGKRIDVTVEDPLAPNPMCVVGWIGPGAHDPDASAASLAMDILWEHDSSRAIRRLEQADMLVQRAGVDSIFSDAGVYMQLFAPAEGVTCDGIVEVLRIEMKRLAEHAVGPEELDEAMLRTISRLVRELDASEDLANVIAADAVLTGDPKWSLKAIARLQQVANADLMSVARKYFSGPPLLMRIEPAKEDAR